MKNPRFCSVVSIGALLFVLSSCTLGGREVLRSIQEVATPAVGESSVPNLAVGANGETYLSWIEVNNAGAKSLKFATRTADGWSQPRTIVEGDTLFLNWADFPSLFPLADGSLAAHWLSTVPDREGYNINIATSRDKGATWSPPVTPHRDGTQTEHGFVSLVPAEGGIAVLWLDSRKLEKGSDDVSLMSTSVSLDGKLGAESEIDDRVCECCQPSSVVTPGGILTVYRDRTMEEIRDIVITRFDGKQWSAPKTISDDKWMILACPIQGPAISAAGEHVAVAWFTAANEKPKVQVALSADGGKTFTAPVQVDEGDPTGRVDVVAMDAGDAVVTWIEHTSRGGEVRARQVSPNGKAHEPVTVGKTSLGTVSGFPRVERSGESIVLAWTDTDEHRIRTAVAGK
jgi:BNR repeat-like domain